VVEGGVDQRGAELALVLEALHLAVVGIQAQRPGVADVLRDTHVEVIRALGQWRRVAGIGYRIGGAGELRDVRGGDHLGGRRREVARIAGMHRGAAGGLPDHAQARAELAAAGAGQRVLVAAHAVVHRPVLADAPFILDVAGPDPGREAGVVDDVDRRGAGLVAVGIGREYPRVVATARMFEAAVDAIAQRVAVAQRCGEIRLQGAGAVVATYGRGDAVEHQVADQVRAEGHAGVTLAQRDLVVGRTQLALQRQHAEAGVLALLLVEVGRIEIGDAEITERR